MLRKKLSLNKARCEEKFRNITPELNHSSCENTEFKKLSEKYELTHSMKASNRKFNKTLFSKLAKRIEERAISFYQFGLREKEKAIHKSVFMDVFNISNKNLKGTISIGELWGNKDSMRHLKENKMFFNKDILLEELRHLNKKKKIEKRKQKGENMEFYNKTNGFQKSHFSAKVENPKESCCRIRQELEELAQDTQQKQNRKTILELEDDKKKINFLRKKLQNQMIVLI